MNDSLNINQTIESVESSSISGVDTSSKIKKEEAQSSVSSNPTIPIYNTIGEKIDEAKIVPPTVFIPKKIISKPEPKINWDSLYFAVPEVKDTLASDSLVIDSLAKDTLANVVLKEVAPVKEIPSIDGALRVPTVSMSVWYTPFLFVLFAVYMYVLGARMKAFKTEILTFFNPAAGGSIFGSEWLQSSPYKFALTCASLCSLGLFGFFASHGNDCTLHPLLIVVSVLATIIVCLLKKWLMDLLQFVYYPGRTTLFSSSFMTIIRLAGLCMVPAVLVLSYSPDSCFNGALYFGFGVLIFAKILMIGKSIVNFFDGFISIFYLFLYLCTLEVLPLVGLSAFLVSIKYIF